MRGAMINVVIQDEDPPAWGETDQQRQSDNSAMLTKLNVA
jgi:hypothetical protein